jgi:hypothetical protein
MVGLTSGRRILLTLATVVVIGVGVVAPAAAERVPPGGDSFQQGCRAIQDYTDGLIAEYKTASDARREEILAELRNWGMTWIQIGCRAVFGDISARIILPPRGLLDDVPLVTVAEADEAVAAPAETQEPPALLDSAPLAAAAASDAAVAADDEAVAAPAATEEEPAQLDGAPLAAGAGADEAVAAPAAAHEQTQATVTPGE